MELKVKIITEAELNAARQTTVALKDTTTAAKETGKALDGMGAKVKDSDGDLKKHGVTVDDVSDKLGKKLFSAGALAAVSFRGIRAAVNLVAPAFDGVSAAASRLWSALQGAVVSSGVVQKATAGIRVALEGLAEFVESKVTPKMLELANKVRDVATAYSDAAKAAGDLLRIQREFATEEAKRAKGVEKEFKDVDAWLGRQKEVLAALRENEKARINLNEQDPVAREKKLADVDLRSDAQGRRLEDEAATKKGGIVQKEVARLDEEILAAGAQLPQMGTLPALAQDAQNKAQAEQAALRENRQNFVIRERIRQMGGAAVSGRTSFAQMATQDREELGAEDQLVYDFVARSGGMAAAVPGIEQALKGSRARVSQTKAARVDAFGRLPRGVGTPAEADTYEKGIDLQMRGRIQGLQEQQDTLGERGQEILGGKVQRNLVAPIQDNTRDTEATGRINDAMQRQLEQEWEDLKAGMREYHKSNLQQMREFKGELKGMIQRGSVPR